MRRLSLPSCLLGFALGALSACASQQAHEASSRKAQLGPLKTAEVLPLTHKTVSRFTSQTEGGEQGSFVLEIFRPRVDLAELKIAGRVQRLIVRDDRVLHATGGELLGDPLEVGRSFQGAFGQVTITKVDVGIDLPAGHLDRCVTTVEESQMPPKRSTSTYCSKAGLVHMKVEAGDASEISELEARLVSHGPRMDVHSDPQP